MPKVFLSYSSKDEEFVRELYSRLTRDGVNCFFDKESIKWGANWVIALEKAIKECEIFIPILTPEFFDSEWAELERTIIVAIKPSLRDEKIRPLLLKQCNKKLLGYLGPIQNIDVSTSEKFEQNYPKICKELGGTPQIKVSSKTKKKLPSVHKLPVRNTMRYKSIRERFVGRVKEIWYIHDIFHAGKTAIIEGVGAVFGTGGIGKTQLAVEYVQRFCGSYPGGVFWVDAERGISGLIVQVLQGAGFKIDTRQKEEDQLAELWRKLNLFEPVLIVLDNFPEDIPLEPWLPPSGSIYTLVTTRRRDLNCARVSLDFMTVKEGVKLINSGDRKFGKDAEELVTLLGGLPLALELARNYLNQRQEKSIQNLLDEIRSTSEIQALDLFTKKYAGDLPTGHVKEIAATFQIGLNHASDTARSVLLCMGLLAPVPVPRRLIRKILDLGPRGGLEDSLDEAVAELVNKLSLVELDEENDPWMHRLITGFIRSGMDQDKALHVKVIKAVGEEMDRVDDDYDTAAYNELEKIVPHAEVLLDSEFIEKGSFIGISNSLSLHNWKHARYRIAERYGRRSLAACQEHFDPSHQLIARGQSDLALVLRELGELEEARDLLRLALTSDEKNFDPSHTKIAIKRSNLALVLQDLGELEEARDLLRLALASGEKNFDPSHPAIAKRRSNLALVLWDLGELEEARDLLRLALASIEKNFDSSHPWIAQARSNLALVLQDLGALEEARDLLRLALASDEKNFDPSHPEIARKRSNLALVLKDLGELEEARDHLRLALASGEKNFDPSHPVIAKRRSNLALVLKALGELEEARDLLRLALASDEKNFDPSHPEIAKKRLNLAAVLKDLGELEEARDLAESAYQSFLKKLGKAHPHTKNAKVWLDAIVEDLKNRK
jgi:tetratricopeptide (TPR) repeat protein